MYCLGVNTALSELIRIMDQRNTGWQLLMFSVEIFFQLNESVMIPHVLNRYHKSEDEELQKVPLSQLVRKEFIIFIFKHKNIFSSLDELYCIFPFHFSSVMQRQETNGSLELAL